MFGNKYYHRDLLPKIYRNTNTNDLKLM